MKMRTIVVSTVVFTALTSTVWPVYASGGAPLRAATGSGPVDPAVQSLSVDQHITIAEATKRVGWQRRAAALDSDMRRSLGQRYASVWVDEAHGGRVKIGVTGSQALSDQARRDITNRGLTDAADVVRVKYSWTDLLAMAPLLGGQLKAANKTSPVQLVPFFEPQYNRIEVYVPTAGMTEPQRRIVSEAQLRFAGRVVLTAYSGHLNQTRCALIGTYDCDAPMRGGVSLYLTNNSNTFQCSTAFNARSVSDGKWYVMTAGHCGSIGTSFSAYQPDKAVFSVIGTVHNRGDPNINNDYGIITMNNPARIPYGWDPKPWVYVKASTGRGVAGTSTDYAYTINGTGGSTVGNRVCAITAVTGTSCGAITRVGYPNPGDYGVANYCSYPGDSGGGVVNSHLAIGINIGYFGTSNCGQAAYTGITEVQQQLNVRVATG